MRSLVGKIEAKWIGFIFFYKCQSMFSDQGCRITLFIFHLPPIPPIQNPHSIIMGVIINISTYITSKSLKPMQCRVEFFFVSKVPFPKHAGLITCPFDQFWKSDLGRIQTMVSVGIKRCVDHPRDTTTLLIPTSQQASSGWTTYRPTAMKICKSQTFCRHFI